MPETQNKKGHDSRKPRRIGLVAGLFLALSGPLAQAETLADALIGAYNNSGLIDQNRALLRAADEDVATAAAALRPIIDYTASVTQDFGERRATIGGISSSADIDSAQLDVGLVASLLAGAAFADGHAALPLKELPDIADRDYWVPDEVNAEGKLEALQEVVGSAAVPFSGSQEKFLA